MAGLAEHVARSSLKLFRGYTSRVISTATGQVHVLDAPGTGAGPPLVMLHGLSSAGVHFLPVLEAVRRGFGRVILPDLPGHGFSGPPSAHTRRAFHDALFDALDLVADEPVAVFGNSLGGYAALRYALERPGRVRGLFLASPAGAAMSAEAIDELRRLFTLTSQDDAVAFVDRLLARPTWLRRPLAWGLRHQFRRPEVEAVLEQAAQEQFLTPAELARLEVPVVLVWGRADRILPAQSLEFFRRYLPPHSRIEEPEGYGHSPFLDAPGPFAARLVAFGQELAASAAPRLDS